MSEALDLAARGSPQAQFRLARLIKTAPDDPVSIRAAKLLANPTSAAGGAKL